MRLEGKGVQAGRWLSAAETRGPAGVILPSAIISRTPMGRAQVTRLLSIGEGFSTAAVLFHSDIWCRRHLVSCTCSRPSYASARSDHIASCKASCRGRKPFSQAADPPAQPTLVPFGAWLRQSQVIKNCISNIAVMRPLPLHERQCVVTIDRGTVMQMSNIRVRCHLLIP